MNPRGRRAASPTVSARLGGHVTLEAQTDGKILACFDSYSVELGTFSAAAADRARELRAGLPLAAFVSGRRAIDKEISLLVRRLAGLGLLEYRLRRARTDEEEVVDWATAAASNTKRYGRFFHEMLDRGVYLAPSQYECLLVGAAHTSDLLDATLAAAREAFQAVSESSAEGSAEG